MAAPLVSILIPAYNERYFAETLASACAQRYPALEIVVCDDSPGSVIEEAAAAAADPRVRYVRNPQRRGFEGNFTECLRQARGELIKYLNDDDRLRPFCIEALASGFDFDPRVTLATSRRAVIDAEGQPAADIFATTPMSHVSCVVPGVEMGDFCLANGANFIGEPSTAMFRRAALAVEPGGVFTWQGQSYHCLADLSLWLRLLARGPIFYHAAVLSEFRMHPGQEQAGAEMDVACIEERPRLFRQARAAGFLQPRGLYRTALKRADDLAAEWLKRPGLAPAHVERIHALRRGLQEAFAAS